MTEFSFTLKYQLAAEQQDTDAMLGRLAEAGCTDALVGVGQAGRLALAFTREAASATQAMASALADVERAVPGSRLVEATPDLVGLTDIGEIVGMSRQGMRKLAHTHFATFPAPVHEGAASLWHLAEVLSWFSHNGSYAVQAPMLQVASAAMQVNIDKEKARLGR